MSDTPRIVLASHGPGGGSGVVAHELASSLVRAGYHATVLTPAPRSGRLDARVRHVRIDAPTYPVLSGPAWGVAMAGAMAAEVDAGADVVHVHYALPWLTSALIARSIARRPFKLVVTLHGTDVVGIGAQEPYRDVLARALANADVLLAPSESLRDEAIRVFGDVGSRIQVIPNAVDPVAHAPIALGERASHRGDLLGRNDASDAFWIAHVSNFRDVKRTGMLAPIVAPLAARHDVMLLLVGAGPGLDACAAAARESLGAGRVVTTGELETSAPVVPLCDALLLPSDYESFGLAALEAMASGVPVVASDVGGLRELLTPDCGFLCDRNHIAAFTSALDRLAADDALRLGMGRAGRERALQHYSPEVALRRHLAVYGLADPEMP